MMDKTLEKTARQAVNIYPDVGARMMNIVSHKLGRDIDAKYIQKKASGDFPSAEEPFLSMQAAYEAAHKMANAEIWHEHVQKEATLGSQTLQRFLTNAAANKFSGPAYGMLQGGEGGSKSVDEELDSNFYNKIKALDAKRALYSIVNDDPNFKSYDHSQIVGAWNALADSHPKLLMQNPSAASALILQHLESNGRRDLYEIGQAQKLENDMK
jgi:hypothetical protein